MKIVEWFREFNWSMILGLFVSTVVVVMATILSLLILASLIIGMSEIGSHVAERF